MILLFAAPIDSTFAEVKDVEGTFEPLAFVQTSLWANGEGIAFHQDNLAVGPYLYNLENGSVNNILRTNTSYLPSTRSGPVAFSPDGKHFAIRKDRKDSLYGFKIFHARAWEESPVTYHTPEDVKCFSFSPDSKSLFVGLEAHCYILSYEPFAEL
jgi:WD40 repeat protein